MLVSCLDYFCFTLKMEAIYSPETFDCLKTTQRYTPEARTVFLTVTTVIRGGLISLWLYKEKKVTGLKKYIYSTCSPLSSTHLWLPRSNFFNAFNKNCFGCAANMRSQKHISTPTYIKIPSYRYPNYLIVFHLPQVWSVFRDVCRFWQVHSKCPKLKRSSSDIHSEQIVSRDPTGFICTSKLTTANGTAPPNGTQSTVSPVMMLGKRASTYKLENC
jgi:hypothetical protein